ncbi:MAG TPA: multicopper oxidase domain-containing protein [Thermodesulfobacteriota bacterium]|nr:multicopper oxidase domain-containing protein [Thermodesulfobacteriota bacterium]
MQGATVEYELTIAQQEVNITGRPTWGMTINGGIPGPTLYFREGDTARIHVHNRMKEDTSIHWHGMLVPPNMDGVPYVSFPPIQPGATFTYEFPIRQSGTYWYHSHTGLQEQRGVYGSIAIEPHEGKLRQADRDHVVVLSDWTDEKPHEVLRTLKRGSEWFGIQKGSGQSIWARPAAACWVIT